MPNTTFTYMSWNIQTYGPSKWYFNKIERVDAIALTIYFSGASLVSIMELSATHAPAILTSIVNQLNAINGVLTLAQDWAWASVTGNDPGSTGSDEAYGFLYRSGVLTVALSPGGTSICGRSTTDRLGNPLRFPTRSSRTGNGRKAAYCAFRENANNNLFSVVTYHAPSSAQAITGTQSMGQAREVYEVNTADPGAASNWVAVTASLISGDFNVNYPDANAYGPILNAPPNGPGGTATIFENSTVRAFDPNPPFHPYWAPSVWWRVSAYDNIFCTGAAVPVALGIVDMISELGQWVAGTDANFPPPNGWPAAAAGLYAYNIPQAFDLVQEQPGTTLVTRPLNVPVDAWLFYRMCLSDHLPATVQVTI